MVVSEGVLKEIVAVRLPVVVVVCLQVLDISANLAEQLPGCVLQLTGLQELHAGEARSPTGIRQLEQQLCATVSSRSCGIAVCSVLACTAS